MVWVLRTLGTVMLAYSFLTYAISGFTSTYIQESEMSLSNRTEFEEETNDTFGSSSVAFLFWLPDIFRSILFLMLLISLSMLSIDVSRLSDTPDESSDQICLFTILLKLKPPVLEPNFLVPCIEETEDNTISSITKTRVNITFQQLWFRTKQRQWNHSTQWKETFYKELFTYKEYTMLNFKTY
jgi:hypothetical protein